MLDRIVMKTTRNELGENRGEKQQTFVIIYREFFGDSFSGILSSIETNVLDRTLFSSTSSLAENRFQRKEWHKIAFAFVFISIFTQEIQAKRNEHSYLCNLWVLPFFLQYKTWCNCRREYFNWITVDNIACRHVFICLL